MSSVNTHKLVGSARDIRDYYVRDLIKYYLGANLGGPELPYATWRLSDAFCEALGIDRERLSQPQYLSKTLLRLLEGKSPSGAYLSDQFVPPNRSMLGEDIVFAAPKSISTAFALAHDDETRRKIEMAHRRAVDKAIERIKQDLAFSRRGKGGAERIPAEIGFICVHQTDARPTTPGGPPMPHLHTHTLIPNVAVCEDGKVRAIDYRGLDALSYSTVYQRELAAALRDAGFVLRQGRHAFEIASISDDLIDKFSPRSAEIKKAAGELAKKTGRQLDEISSSERKLLERRVQKQKFEKSTEYNDISACLPVWMERAGEDAPADVFAGEKADREACIQQCRARLQETAESIAVLDKSKVEALIASNTLAIDCSDTERALLEQTLFDEFFLERTSYRKMSAEHLEGQADGAPIQRAVSRIALAAERHGLQISEKLATQGVGLKIDIESALASKHLTAEQANAIRELANGQQLEILRGGAGVGKTYAMNPLVEAHMAAGGRVYGAAVANKIAFALGEAGIPESNTMSMTKLSALIADGKLQLDGKTMLVIDESSMVGLRELNQILDAADESGARIILVGDDSQIGAVGLQALEVMQEGLRRAGLEERSILSTIRQKSDVEKALAAAFRNGVEVETALHFLDEQDRLKIGKDRDHTLAMCANRWNSARDENAGHVFIAATNAEAQEIALAVRSEREKRGDLSGEEVSVPILGNGGLDDEPENSMLLRTGDRIRFYDRVTEYTGRRPRNVAVNGTIARFVGVETDEKGKRYIVAEHLDKNDRVKADEAAVAARAHELAMSDPKNGKSWSDLPKSDRDEFMRKAREADDLPPSRFRVDIDKIKDQETKRLRLSYADASTVHSAQGISATRATGVVLDGTGSVNSRLGYVAASRHEKDFTLIANSETLDNEIRHAGVADHIERHDRISALSRAFQRDTARPFAVNIVDYAEKKNEDLRIKTDRVGALPRDVIRGVLFSGRKIADFQKARAAAERHVDDAQANEAARAMAPAMARLAEATAAKRAAIVRLATAFERAKEKLGGFVETARNRFEKAKAKMFGRAVERREEAELRRDANAKLLPVIEKLREALKARRAAIEKLGKSVQSYAAAESAKRKVDVAANANEKAKPSAAEESNRRLDEREKQHADEIAWLRNIGKKTKAKTEEEDPYRHRPSLRR
jgi:conjugative relaxase-like TrwC/TraI family protein